MDAAGTEFSSPTPVYVLLDRHLSHPVETAGLTLSHKMPAQNQDAESAFTFIPRGASIQEFRVAGHNLVQNFPEAALYASVPHPYIGETIGRTTNRIKGAVIHNLNGKTYKLNANNGENNLHGGVVGWGSREWDGPKAVSKRGKEGVMFRYLSPDGEEGFPGTVEARVWYVAGMEEGKTVLEVEYEVELVGDECEETVVGITNHRYLPTISCLSCSVSIAASTRKMLWLIIVFELQLLQPEPSFPYYRRDNMYSRNDLLPRGNP